MTVPDADYADLAYLSYRPLAPSGSEAGEGIEALGNDVARYSLVLTTENPNTGYQGGVFVSEENGETVAVHRGTQMSELRDIQADLEMVARRTNAQLADALILVTQAKAIAAKWHDEHPGSAAPEVTVTGHSLGGTLAQLTARDQ